MKEESEAREHLPPHWMESPCFSFWCFNQVSFPLSLGHEPVCMLILCLYTYIHMYIFLAVYKFMQTYIVSHKFALCTKLYRNFNDF